MNVKTGKLAVLLLVLISFAGCAMTDYQLEFEITGWTVDVNTVTVNYTLTNTGRESLSNARVKVAIAATDGTIISEEWTGYFQMGVGESTSGSVSIDDSSGGNFDHATITGAGWDKNTE